ncbi:hypothetical protein ACFFWD_12450 [Bradyrhizobium erythrophlei]|uniref:hypothetical protein n=1 Tax=Bradyrhizobium erythrophlei TaxID=1437360 RepID=UPI0035E46B45
MLAIATSSEAIASAAKIAATAQRPRSGGSPSATGAIGAAVVAVFSSMSRLSRDRMYYA